MTGSCESCGTTVEPTDDTAHPCQCPRCGVYTGADGSIPRSIEKRCSTCHGPVVYGVLKDARKGIRGYKCIDCDLIVSTEDKPPEPSASAQAPVT